jgi:adenylate kinase family enzyme
MDEPGQITILQRKSRVVISMLRGICIREPPNVERERNRSIRWLFSHIMQRILILGCPGAGKSTLARQIGQSLHLPVIHLDREYWRAGWRSTPDAEFDEAVAKLVERQCWVMDGNYHRTLDVRLARTDLAIHLDFPRWRCLSRICRRTLIHCNFTRSRPDMAEGCPEQWDWEFIEWIWDFRNEIRPKTAAALERHSRRVRVITLRTPGDVARFIKSIRRAGTTLGIAADQLDLVPS